MDLGGEGGVKFLSRQKLQVHMCMYCSVPSCGLCSLDGLSFPMVMFLNLSYVHMYSIFLFLNQILAVVMLLNQSYTVGMSVCSLARATAY
jgi:hypothetical protein